MVHGACGGDALEGARAAPRGAGPSMDGWRFVELLHNRQPAAPAGEAKPLGGQCWRGGRQSRRPGGRGARSGSWRAGAEGLPRRRILFLDQRSLWEKHGSVGCEETLQKGYRWAKGVT